MSPRLRWGLIGASDIAATRVLPKIRERGDTVNAIQSGTLERGRSFANTAGIEHVVTDVGDLVERDDIDAVYISSANHHHHRQAIAAAEAGKHVLCEKPIALSIADAERMLRVADDNDVVLAVNHHLPGADTHTEIRRLVRAGAIGRLLAVRLAHAVMLPERLRGWRVNAPEGGGVVMDITCHDASVLDPLLAEHPHAAAGLAVRQGSWAQEAAQTDVLVPDAVMATLSYKSGVLVQLHDAFTISYGETRLEVFGEEGTITGLGVMTQDPSGSVWLQSEAGTREIDIPDRADLYMVGLDSFAAAIDGTGEPSVTGEAGVRALSVALAVHTSLASGETVTLSERSASHTVRGT